MPQEYLMKSLVRYIPKAGSIITKCSREKAAFDAADGILLPVREVVIDLSRGRYRGRALLARIPFPLASDVSTNWPRQMDLTPSE
jgi:hypothetical protein